MHVSDVPTVALTETCLEVTTVGQAAPDRSLRICSEGFEGGDTDTRLPLERHSRETSVST